MSPASYLTAPPRVAATGYHSIPVTMAAMEWWLWALVGVGASAVGVAAATVFAVLRGARSAERRATDAAHDLVRMTDDLERRIREARQGRPHVEHEIEIRDEGRYPALLPDDPDDAS